MTRRTRLIVAPLLPFLTSLAFAACSSDSNDSDAAAVTPSSSAPPSGTMGAGGPPTPPATGAMGMPGNPGAVAGPTGAGVGMPAAGATGTPAMGATGTPAMGATGTPVMGPTGTPVMGDTGTPVMGDTATPMMPGTAEPMMPGTAEPMMTGTGEPMMPAEPMMTGTDGGDDPPPPPTELTVQLNEVRQIIRGFGVNATITDGSDLPWNQLYTLEGENALGLSILRIGMHESGGHRNVPNGWQSVRSLGARVIGSCWSALAEWKTNNSTTGGGHLRPENYTDWATRIAEYANDNGLYAMSIANEADFASCSPSQGRPCSPPLTDEYESMVYTGQEMADFVAIAGPIFDQIAPDTLMIAPEASLWQHVWSNISPDGRNLQGGGYLSSDPLECNCYANEITDAAAAMCAPHCLNGQDGSLASGGYDYGHHLWANQDAWNAFDIMGVHQYETQVGYKWPDDVNGGVRDKEVWQTEMSGVSHWPESGPSTDIANGVAVARWIHSALTVGEASAWLYWWYKSYYNDNNEGLGLMLSDGINAAPRTKRYFTMGNFSRYIRPDVFHAVQVAGPSPDNVMVSAYLGDNGEVVIVAINETMQAVDVPIAITGGTVPATMVPYVTSGMANWAEGTAVPVTDGSLPASLPSMSVTTFVSQ